MEFYLTKTHTGNIPTTDADREKLAKVEYGESFKCKTVSKRNLKFHNKYMALIQLGWQNKREYLDDYFPMQPNFPDEFRKEVIMRAGYYESYKNFKGETQYRAKSISFARMGNEEFSNLYSATIDVMIKWVMEGLDKEDLMNELAGFM